MSAAVPTKTINPLLQKYLAQLALHPLRTKALTTAVLCFLQEVLGSNLAGIPARKTTNAPFIVNALTRTHVNLKALKMALYGLLVSAPLSHYLVGLLQRAFSGKQGKGARIAQILAHNLLVSPIQASVYLMSMAIINGRDVVKTVRNGFFPVIRVSWIVSPLSMTIAQNFLPVELWVPFFNAIQFVLGTYFNMRVKQMQLAAAKKEKDSDKEH